MTPTVTLDFNDYLELTKELQASKKTHGHIIDCLKLLYNIDLNDLYKRASDIRESRDRAITRELVYSGKL